MRRDAGAARVRIETAEYQSSDGLPRARVLLVFRRRDAGPRAEPAAERPLLALNIQWESLARPVTFRPEKDREVGRLRGRRWFGARARGKGIYSHEDTLNEGPDGLSKKVGQAY